MKLLRPYQERGVADIRRCFGRDHPGNWDGETAHGEPPDLLIDSSNPTATARRLAALIAQRYDFLFNGNAPVRIAVEAGNLPRAIEVTNEAVRVLAHEICKPMRLSKGEWVPAALPKESRHPSCRSGRGRSIHECRRPHAADTGAVNS